MSPAAILALLVVLWAVAALFWFLDSPDPRQTADVILEKGLLTEDPQYV